MEGKPMPWKVEAIIGFTYGKINPKAKQNVNSYYLFFGLNRYHLFATKYWNRWAPI